MDRYPFLCASGVGESRTPSLDPRPRLHHDHANDRGMVTSTLQDVLLKSLSEGAVFAGHKGIVQGWEPKRQGWLGVRSWMNSSNRSRKGT